MKIKQLIDNWKHKLLQYFNKSQTEGIHRLNTILSQKECKLSYNVCIEFLN